jgi:hypothetical protein
MSVKMAVGTSYVTAVYTGAINSFCSNVFKVAIKKEILIVNFLRNFI